MELELQAVLGPVEEQGPEGKPRESGQVVIQTCQPQPGAGALGTEDGLSGEWNRVGQKQQVLSDGPGAAWEERA